MEWFGRLRAPAMLLLGSLADAAVQAGGPGLSHYAFISGAHWELSVALCRGNTSLCSPGLYAAAAASGLARFVRSLGPRPTWLSCAEDGCMFPCPCSACLCGAGLEATQAQLSAVGRGFSAWFYISLLCAWH
jgi:hypothetical protein